MTVDLARMTRMVQLFYGLEAPEAVQARPPAHRRRPQRPRACRTAAPDLHPQRVRLLGAGRDRPDRAPPQGQDGLRRRHPRALKALGLNAVGPKAVLGHEMAHHVQYEDDLFVSDLTGPEATRRTELMADAFGSYFATHTKGLNLAPNALLQVTTTFTTSATASSPRRATTARRTSARPPPPGASRSPRAATALKVLPSLRLDAKFEKVLPLLVASDAPEGPGGPRRLTAARSTSVRRRPGHPGVAVRRLTAGSHSKFSQQAAAAGLHPELEAAVHPEVVLQAGDPAGDGALADPELAGDRLVGQARGHEGDQPARHRRHDGSSPSAPVSAVSGRASDQKTSKEPTSRS